MSATSDSPCVGDRVTPENVTALPIGSVVTWELPLENRILTATKSAVNQWSNVTSAKIGDRGNNTITAGVVYTDADMHDSGQPAAYVAAVP